MNGKDGRRLKLDKVKPTFIEKSSDLYLWSEEPDLKSPGL